MIYLVIGVTIAFLLTSTMIFTVCHCINRRLRGPENENSQNASKMATEADEFDHLQPHQRSSSRQTFNRQSYLQQSPLTEETISLDDFDRRSLRSLQPKLIYTQEFSDGLMVLPHDENGAGSGHDELGDVKG